MNDQTETAAAQPKRKKGALRWVLRLGLLGLLLVGLLLFFAPSIASSGWGKARVTGAINDSIAGTVRIDALKLSWGGGQSITGLTLSDPDGKQVVALDSVTTGASLWSLVTGGRDLGETTVDGLVVDLVADKEGPTNLQRAIAPTKTDGGSDAKPSGKGDGGSGEGPPVTTSLVVRDAELTLTQAGLDPVHVDRLNLKADLPTEGPIAFEIAAAARQADATGSVKGGGTYDVDTGVVVGELDVRDLPTAGLDALLNRKGVLIEAIGDRIVRATFNAEQPDARGAQDFRVGIETPRLKGGGAARLADGAYSIDGQLDLTATPALVAALVRDNEQLQSLTLDRSVLIKCQLAQGKLPDGPFDPGKVSGRVIVTTSRGALTYVEGDRPTRFAWDGLTLTAAAKSDRDATDATTSLAKGVKVDLDTTTTLDGQPGRIKLDGDAGNLFDGGRKLHLKGAHVDATLTATALPIALADRLAKQDGRLVEALGDQLDLTATARRTAIDEPIQVEVDANSDTLVADLDAFLDDHFKVKSGSTVKLKPSAALLKRYVTDASGYTVTADQPVVLTIHRLECPMPADGVVFMRPDSTKLDVSVTLPQMAVTDPIGAAQPVGPLVVSGGKVDLKADKLSAPTVNLVAHVSAVGDGKGLVATYGARQLYLKADANTTLDNGFALGGVDLVLQAGNRTRDLQPLDSVGLSGRITKGFERFGLSKPATISYRVMPAMLAGEKGQATLAGPAPVKLNVDALDLPLKGFTLSGVKAAAAFESGALELAGDPRFAGAKLTDLKGGVSIDGGRSLALNLDGKTAAPGATRPGSINADVDLTDWLDKDGEPALGRAGGKAVVTLDDVPTPLVDALAQQQGKLPAMIGDSVDVVVNYDASGGSKTLALDAEGEHLKADGAFKVTEADTLNLTRPLDVTWVVTPAAYALLTKPTDGGPAPMRLVKPVTFAVKADKLSDLPLGGEGFDLRKLALRSTIDATRIALRDTKTQGVTTISALKGTVSADPLGEGLVSKFNGVVAYADPKRPDAPPATGKLDVGATLSDLFDAEGGFDTKALSADVAAQLAELPVVALDQMVKNANGRLHALLGDKAQIDLGAQIVKGEGPFRFAVTSPNAGARLVGRYAGGVVTLDEDAVVTTKVTRELGKKLLKDINILLESAYSSDKPIKLTVPAKNFRLDLNEFDITKVAAEQVRLELGTIKLDNSGLLPLVLSAIGRRNTDQMEARFTPLVATLKDGELHYDRRLDMLIDGSFHLANFGDVDLANRRLHTIVGITADTLDKAFGAEGLPADTIYQIPVTGSIDEPKVDLVKAGGELASLRERAKLAKQNPLLSALLEGVLKDLRKDDKPVPPKSQDPLPWVVKAPPRQAEPEQPKREERPRQPDKSLEEQLIEEGLKRIFE